jgi:hypothetical protein
MVGGVVLVSNPVATSYICNRMMLLIYSMTGFSKYHGRRFLSITLPFGYPLLCTAARLTVRRQVQT